MVLACVYSRPFCWGNSIEVGRLLYTAALGSVSNLGCLDESELLPTGGGGGELCVLPP